MKKYSVLFSLIFSGFFVCNSLFSQQVKYHVDPQTGALNLLQIQNDSRNMNWILEANGKQYPWVTDKYGWGLGYFTETKDGKTVQREWKQPFSIKGEGAKVSYWAGNIQIDVERSISGDDLVEKYTLINKGKQSVSLSNIGIYTPFNDNYPNSQVCIAARTHAHIWDGGHAAYINAMQMGAQPPHLGLVMMQGCMESYEIWERGRDKENSQTRGVIAVNVPDVDLKPGKKTSFSWCIFSHTGWSDFRNKVLEKGNIWVECNQYTFQKGDTARLVIAGDEKLLKNCSVSKNGVDIPVVKNGDRWTLETIMDETGENRFEIHYGKGKKTHVNCLVFKNYDELINNRVNFIIDRQQMNDTADLRYGAYMVYDNEKDEIYLNDTPNANPVDRDEGAERMGMGVLLIKQYQLTKDEKIKESLLKYAKFIREGLQDENYKTWSSVDKQGRNRAYNYAWVADFYFRMYQITGEKQYIIDGYKTLRSMYSQFGHDFYAIGTPVRLGLSILKEAGMDKEYEILKSDFIQIGDTYVRNGLNYPTSEVNYEQSIVAPGIQFLAELYQVTGIQKYLDEAKRQLPVLEAFGGFQPSYHMNEIAIRHWDGYWFGKKEFFGDNYPHYWSTLTGAVYYNYFLCTNDISYKERAENIVRNNLCLFSEDGRGYCAYVYPYRVNGEKAEFYDPYANDQDWALVYYLLVNNGF